MKSPITFSLIILAAMTVIGCGPKALPDASSTENEAPSTEEPVVGPDLGAADGTSADAEEN